MLPRAVAIASWLLWSLVVGVGLVATLILVIAPVGAGSGVPIPFRGMTSVMLDP